MHMNKLTKGTIAAGAAVALLLGTGSTLAYWNDSAMLAGTTIQSGNLALAQTGTPTWTLQHTTGTATTITQANIATLRVVPGDKLVFTGDYTITAQGKNLKFEVAIAGGSFTGDPELVAAIQKSATFKIDNVTGATHTVRHADDASGTYPVQVQVTLDWPFKADGSTVTTDNAAKLKSLSFADFAITVKQLDNSL